MDVPTAIYRGSCLDYWAPPWHLSAHEIAANIRPSLNATRIPATVVRRRVVRACHARQYRAAEPMRRCSARVKDPGHDRKISEPLRSRPRGVFHFGHGQSLPSTRQVRGSPDQEPSSRPQRHSFCDLWGHRSKGGLLACNQKISVRVRVSPPICGRGSTAENSTLPWSRCGFDPRRPLQYPQSRSVADRVPHKD